MSGDIERIREALHFIPANYRETWLRMGMAIKSEVGDTGFDMWEAWSQQDESFDTRAARDVWKSIRTGGKVRIGTLFHEAKANGWRDDGTHQKPTPEELAERRRIAADRAAKEEGEIARERAEAAKKAAAILKAATEAKADHPYLLRKRVSSVATLREIDASAAAAILGYAPKSSGELLNGRLLVAPVKVGEGLSTLELIDQDGRKSAIYGGAKAGGYWAAQPLPDDVDTLLIGEGVATVLTAKEASGHPAIAALSSGNLAAVAQAMRERYPAAALVILADLVKATGAPDPHAIEAARSVAGLLAVPRFGSDRDPNMTDFNDLHQAQGLDAVQRAIESAAAAPVEDDHPESERAPAGDIEGSKIMQPMPLPKLPPVPDFPLAILPDVFKEWASDAADRARYRPDFFAVAAMTALGSVIGRKIGIRMKGKDDWTEYANVWGAIIGDPSDLKSPAKNDASSPLRLLQVCADEAHAQAMQAFSAQEEAYKLRRDARKKMAAKALEKDADAKLDMGKDDAPEAPPARTFWTSDVNDAALSEILVVNPNGLLLERDELSTLLSNLEDEKQASLRGMLLSGWSGKEGFRSDRIVRGVTYIPKYSISLFGGIQPGLLMRYVRGAFTGERADGLLQRFQLIVWPDPQPFEYVDRWPNKHAKEAANKLFQFADTFDAAAIGSKDTFGNDPPFLRFSPDAQEMFAEWYLQFMQSSRGTNSENISAPLASHFGKYPGLLGKLCLIIHIADDGQSKSVSIRTLTKALAWLQYLTPHAHRVYHAAQSPETGAAALLLSRIKRNALPPSFKAWELTRNQWHGLTDREAVKKACRLLFEYRWLIEIDPGGTTGGRPADPIYQVSPLACGDHGGD